MQATAIRAAASNDSVVPAKVEKTRAGAPTIVISRVMRA